MINTYQGVFLNSLIISSGFMLQNKILDFLKIIFKYLQHYKLSPLTLIITKSIKKLEIFLLIPLGVLILIFILLVSPIIVVRLGKLTSQRIGHFAGDTELYLCEKDAGINQLKKSHIDLWYNNWPICNKQLAKMWGRRINVLPSWLLASADFLISLNHGGSPHKIKPTTSNDRDVHNLFDKSDSHLSFTYEEISFGKEGLEKLGIPPEAPFICLHVRDNSYLSNTIPWQNWSYHDYRNCDIQNYTLAAKKLSNLDYYVIRMGVHVNEAMNIQNKKIIDYAANGLQSDFMDIFLGANCMFCISNGSGFDAVPYIFRKPIVFIDHVPLKIISTYSNKFLITTKKIKLCTEDRLLTFKEIIDSGLGDLHGINQRIATTNDIELIESSPEEIVCAVLEMESRINGNWQTTHEDEVIQRRFWEIFPKTGMHGEIRSRIGKDFLYNNRNLLS